MIPITPAIVFGFVLKASGGTVALPYLFALCSMLFTAIGYAYFVKRHPLAGSIYHYVSKSSKYIYNYVPWVPYEMILVTFIIFTGLLNLIGANPLAKL